MIRRINLHNITQIHRLKSALTGSKPLASYNKQLKFETKVPKNCVEEILPRLTPTKIDEDTICLLEHLSLVDCANKQGIKTLEDAILFADKILHINTDNVEPMFTILEDRYLMLRDDKVTDGNCQKDILKNAALTEEDYFVAPPGNIPLQPRDNLLHEDILSINTKKSSIS